MYELFIQNKDKIYSPIIEGEIKYTTEIAGAPSKLAFKVVKDNIINFQEGNQVIFRVDNTDVFYGFVFAKERNREQIISVTAYDQLRYLKNKDSYIFKNKKASEIVQMIANDFHLNIGDIEDTGFIIPKRVEDRTTLMDIIINALKETLVYTKKIFVLYDDFGKLCLKNIESLKLPENLVISGHSVVDFTYKTDIDSDTYNQIKLIRDNETTGKRDVYIKKDSSSINDWGVLQYYETVDKNANPAQIKEQAAQILTLKNRKTKSLTIKDALGDKRVRAGKSIMTVLENIGDISIAQYLIIDRCEHIFRNSEHFMSLDLRGNY